MGFFPESGPLAARRVKVENPGFTNQQELDNLIHNTVEAPDNETYSEFYQHQIPQSADSSTVLTIKAARPDYSIVGIFASCRAPYNGHHTPVGKNRDGASFYISASGNELRVSTGEDGDSNKVYGGTASVWLYYRKVVVISNET